MDGHEFDDDDHTAAGGAPKVAMTEESVTA